MTTWIVISYPTPDGVHARYTYGLVTAATEGAAKLLVAQRLQALGLDTSGYGPGDIGLVPWDHNLPHVTLVFG